MSALRPTHPLRWGILGTGRIAGTFARGVAASALGRVAAVGSRAADSARTFAQAYGIVRAHASYAALLADPEVDAVYIATPHPGHLEWVLAAARAGKSILCEKPLGLSLREVEQMVAAAREQGVLLMEGFMYRCHPQTAALVELVRSGVLGRIGLIQATFGFHAEFSAGSRLWANELAGGGILDVGGYTVSLARLLAGAAIGQPWSEPLALAGAGHLHPETGVDAYAAATLTFPHGVLAQVACGVGLTQENAVRVYGSAGWAHVPDPWVPGREGQATTLWLHRAGQANPEPRVITPARPLYALEADAFARTFAQGALEVPEMPLGDTLGNAAALDRWRAAIGLVYASEHNP